MMKKKPIIRVVNIMLIIYLVIAFLYVLLIVQPVLYFHHVQPAFIKSFGFIYDYAKHPGGLAELSGNFLMQAFAQKYSGAFIFFIVSIIIWLLMRALLNTFSGHKLNNLLALVPLTFVIVLANNYNLPYPVVVSVAFLLLVLLFTSRIATHTAGLILSYMAGAVSVYWFSGSGYFLLYSVSALCMLINFRKKNRYWIGAIIIGFMLMFPVVVSTLIYPLPPESIYFYFFAPKFYFMAYKPSILFYIFLFSIPSLVLYTKLHSFLLKTKNLKEQKVGYGYLPAAGLGMVFLLAGISHHLLYTPDEHKVVASDFYCYHNNSQQAARSSVTLRNYSYAANVNYNLAISKAGRLTDSFFDFFQVSGMVSLYPDYEFSPSMSFVATDFYYHLGYISEARHWAYESLVFYPYSPRALKSLVKIHLVTGEYKAAERYLSLLEKGFNNSKFVQEYKPYFSDTVLVLQDEEIMYKRSCIPAGRELSPFIYHRFKELLEANPNNKQALEWLLLYYLLEGELEQFMELYNNCGDSGISSVYEEAILLYGEKAGIPVVEDYKISKATVARFKEFKQELKRYNGKQRAAMNGMYRQFGSSYMFFLQFLYPRIIKPDYLSDYDETQAI